MNQQELNNYFNTHWRGQFNQYLYSGKSLVKKIKSGELVLDVGCGINFFKPLIPNLIGIDPAFDQADFKTTIEDFTTELKFDVAFCLGSINFGDKLNIMNQIACVINCLKPTARIYWRCNPGYADHDNEECNRIKFYPWSIDEHVKLSELFRFRLMICCWDSNRIYAEWSRSA